MIETRGQRGDLLNQGQELSIIGSFSVRKKKRTNIRPGLTMISGSDQHKSDPYRNTVLLVL